MKAPRTRISSAIADRTLKSGASAELVREIAAYLVGENRVGELNSIMRDVQADWATAGYVEVLASTAHELSPTVRIQITKRIQTLYPDATQIIVTEVLDPSLIGGVRLSLANQQLDLSVEAKLNKFKQLTADNSGAR